MFERATREWTTSPTITSRIPSRVPRASRRVSASSSAWDRVRMDAVAGVHDAQAGGASRQVRRPGGAVAQHEGRDPRPLERAQRVDERFALGDAAARDGQVDRRRSERLGSQLERDARACRCLVEGEADDLGLQQ